MTLFVSTINGQVKDLQFWKIYFLLSRIQDSSEVIFQNEI